MILHLVESVTNLQCSTTNNPSMEGCSTLDLVLYYGLDWIGSPGGVRNRAPYSANKYHVTTLSLKAFGIGNTSSCANLPDVRRKCYSIEYYRCCQKIWKIQRNPSQQLKLEVKLLSFTMSNQF